MKEFNLSEEELNNQELHSGVGGLYRKEDVKSAVEWLKSQFDYIPEIENNVELIKSIKKLIDETFEDVI